MAHLMSILKLLSKIDWFTHEDVDTAFGSVDQLTELEKQASLFVSTLNVPIDRHQNSTTLIEVNRTVTVIELLQIIKDFYEPWFICVNFEDDTHEYIGTSTYGIDNSYSHSQLMDPKTRRGWMECNGLVRFEGLKSLKNNSYYLVLGT